MMTAGPVGKARAGRRGEGIPGKTLPDPIDGYGERLGNRTLARRQWSR